jgi:hypothetical protein
MTKIMGILVIVLVIWGGYELFCLWDKYDTEKDIKEQEAAHSHISPQGLGGMPYQLESSYTAAEKNGATGIRNWLKAYGSKIEDPRKAWIELDYVVAVSSQDPVEAKKVFAEVKDRINTNSPIYPRIKDLSKTYQ